MAWPLVKSAVRASTRTQTPKATARCAWPARSRTRARLQVRPAVVHALQASTRRCRPTCRALSVLNVQRINGLIAVARLKATAATASRASTLRALPPRASAVQQATTSPRRMQFHARFASQGGYNRPSDKRIARSAQLVTMLLAKGKLCAKCVQEANFLAAHQLRACNAMQADPQAQPEESVTRAMKAIIAH